jgi:hypothetical protein
MSSPLTNEAAKYLLEHMKESVRLRQLSDLDLIRECMKSEVSDDPLVEELMNRLIPNWLDQL